MRPMQASTSSTGDNALASISRAASAIVGISDVISAGS
jgi:hypothetical protein